MKRITILIALFVLTIQVNSQNNIIALQENNHCWDFAEPAISLIIDNIKEKDIDKINPLFFENETIIARGIIQTQKLNSNAFKIIIVANSKFPKGNYKCKISFNKRIFEIPITVHSISQEQLHIAEFEINESAYYKQDFKLDLRTTYDIFDNPNNYQFKLINKKTQQVIKEVSGLLLSGGDLIKKEMEDVEIHIIWRQPETDKLFNFFQYSTKLKVPEPKLNFTCNSIELKKNKDSVFSIIVGPISYNYDILADNLIFKNEKDKIFENIKSNYINLKDYLNKINPDVLKIIEEYLIEQEKENYDLHKIQLEINRRLAFYFTETQIEEIITKLYKFEEYKFYEEYRVDVLDYIINNYVTYKQDISISDLQNELLSSYVVSISYDKIQKIIHVIDQIHQEKFDDDLVIDENGYYKFIISNINLLSNNKAIQILKDPEVMIVDRQTNSGSFYITFDIKIIEKAENSLNIDLDLAISSYLSFLGIKSNEVLESQKINLKLNNFKN